MIERIRERSRDEYRTKADERLVALRQWARANGEKALVIGIAAGVAFMFSPKFFITIFLLVAAVLFVVWNIALPEASKGEKGRTAEGKSPNASSERSEASDMNQGGPRQ